MPDAFEVSEHAEQSRRLVLTHSFFFFVTAAWFIKALELLFGSLGSKLLKKLQQYERRSSHGLVIGYRLQRAVPCRIREMLPHRAVASNFDESARLRSASEPSTCNPTDCCRNLIKRPLVLDEVLNWNPSISRIFHQSFLNQVPTIDF